MKKLLLFCGSLLLNTLVFAQDFSLQIINNSTSGAPEMITPLDVYINDSLYASGANLAYQSATDWLDLPAGQGTRIALAYAPSDSVDEAFVIYNLNQFEAGDTYVAILNGAFGNPNNPFRLELAGGLAGLPELAEQIQIRPFNGLSGTPSVRLQVQRSGQAAQELDLGNFGSFNTLPIGRHYANLWIEDGSAPLLFQLDFPETDSTNYTLLTTGSITGIPGPGLYAVSEDGTVIQGRLQAAVDLVINEIDYDQPGTDEQEFIELKHNGTTALLLEGLSLELFNGSTNLAYDQISLPDITLAPQSYFTICFSESVNNCDLQVQGSIQNGGSAPDAVLLTRDGAILDAVSYEGTIPSITEGRADTLADTDGENQSISRIPDGRDQDNNTLDFQSVCSTPGAPNVLNRDCSIPATQDSTFVQIINDYEGEEGLQIILGDQDFGSLPYQSAAAFVKVPVGVERSLSTYAGADILQDPLLDSTFIFQENTVYTIVLEGTDLSDLHLEVNPSARTKAGTPFATDFNFYNGLPNSSELNILIKRVGFAARDLAGFAFSDYNSALPGLYLIDLFDKATGDVLATFELDLKQTGGQANTILISRPAGQQGAITLFSINGEGQATLLPLVEFAHIQLIQNIPNIQVDVYVEDVLVADNVNYRSATSYLQVRANRDLNLEVKGAESTPADPPILAFSDVRFQALTSALLVLGGDGTDSSPADLFILKNALASAIDTAEVSLSFFHGGTDVNPLSFQGEQGEPIAEAVNFGQFRDYQSFETKDLVLSTQETDSGRALGFYGANLSAKKGLSGLVFSSGVVEDSQTFGLFIAFSDGTVLPMQPRAYSQAQFVNNLPDSNRYDLYYGSKKLLADLAFRKATSYLNVEAGMSKSLRLVPAGADLDSNIVLEQSWTLLPDSSYQVFFNGQMGNANYPPQYSINDQAQFQVGAAVLPVTTHHGGLSLSSLDWSAEDGTVLAADLSFGTFGPAMNLAPLRQLLRITEQPSGRSIGAFEATFDEIAPGSSLTLFVSGEPSSDFGLGLYAVLEDGTVLNFASTAFAKMQMVNAIADRTIDVYLNNELLVANLASRQAIPFQTVRAGEVQELTIVAAGNSLPNTSSSTLSFTANAEEVLSVFAAGEDLQDALFLNRNALDNAGGDNKFLFNFFQGTAQEEGIDLIIQDFTTLYRDVQFGAFTEYTLIEPLSSDPVIVFELGQSDSREIISVYNADFSAYGNQAMTLFTTGSIEGDFGLWGVLPDGVTVPFTPITSTQEDLLEMSALNYYPNPVSRQLLLNFELKEGAKIAYQLLDMSGKQILNQQLGQRKAGPYQETIQVEHLPEGVYLLRLQVDQQQLGRKIVVKH